MKQKGGATVALQSAATCHMPELLVGVKAVNRSCSLGTRRIRCCPTLPGVVTAAGPHLKFLIAFRVGVHFDGAKAAFALRLGRLISDGVLIADVMRDLLGDGIHFARALREKRHAARFLSHLPQRSARPLRVLLAQ